MQDQNDFIKHLRNTQFAYVLAALAIIITYSSSNSIYKNAASQLQDLIQIDNQLTTQYLAENISTNSDIKGNEKNLDIFLRSSLQDYFEVFDIPAKDFKIHLHEVTTHKPNEFGHFSDVIAQYSDHYRTDNKYWFGHQLCLLSDGKNIYAHPSEVLHKTGYSKTALSDFKKFINHILNIDIFYKNPEFHAQYADANTNISEQFQEIPENAAELLTNFTGLDLYVEINSVTLVSNVNRKVYERSQAHAMEDPAGYWDYNFDFDMLKLKIAIAGYRSQPSTNFQMNLPIMFQLEKPSFIKNLLEQPSLDNVYLARYLSGAKSFEQLFPDLAKVSNNMNSINLNDLDKYLQERAISGDSPINILGLQIKRELIDVWGVFVMICIQLYFSIHYSYFIGKKSDFREITSPWIGLYRDWFSIIIFQLSIFLPFLVCIYILYSYYSNSSFNLLVVLWTLVSLIIIFSVEVNIVRYHNRLSKG